MDVLIQISSEKKEMFNIDVKILDIKQADNKNVMIKVSYLVGSFTKNITWPSKACEFKSTCNESTFSVAVSYIVKNSTCK
ncbi:hypothetical protein CSPB12327_04480 [Campylobacter sp. RM12327]|uniref:hypothetical protein n=1 Tax=Campylobacter sputorum TaxID=206 RepID=UPI000B770DC4|nr:MULTISPECIES: hypothetical protein [Campylobacter]ASM40098.1 hypothetical protein CSPB_0874 [Campylobacter sputorum]MBE7358143.1 hypothetical protein [Campylobacter sp. RM11302]MBF6669397.1 hypothetical protein [Campylobacter sp. RM12327]MBF6674401.1 hypothetical protein [Campylobacter sp. RM13538]MBF6676152.1 hypothetical protein [Campylobacter sp. RM12321]